MAKKYRLPFTIQTTEYQSLILFPEIHNAPFCFFKKFTSWLRVNRNM
jgi:hypothetical protein